MANIYDMSDTWNDGATTFTSIKMNVTDTASASGSLLMDLQVGGVSAFSVDKNGYAYTNRIIKMGDIPTYWSGFIVSDTPAIRATNVTVATFGRTGTNGKMTLGGGVTVETDAANTLAQRNSTNAQTFNLYNTYTDASNYERGFMKWNSNELQIGTEGAGTGSARTLSIGTTNTTTRLVAQQDALQFTVGGGTFNFGRENVSTGALTLNQSFRPTGVYLAERTAPSAAPANNVVIYAEDNGAGKTRLMALFSTGAAQQIAIEP